MDIFSCIVEEHYLNEVLQKEQEKIHTSQEEAREILMALASVRISLQVVDRICATLGKPGRSREISAQGSGGSLFDIHRITGSIQLVAFLEWWLLEDVFEKLGRCLQEEFAVCNMLERSTLSSCRYQVGGERRKKDGGEGENGRVALPDVFKFFENSKGDVGISEYSVGQTTLEQIFNNFAGSSSNPEVAALT